MSRHIESQIQRACKRWFDIQYPQFAPLLFAVPNGGLRGKLEAAIMKAEGMTAGVSDMIFLMSKKGYTSLCIEFKTEKGRQSPQQKDWQRVVEMNGSKYVIIRCFEDFVKAITAYLC
jgi:hypothetical protein